jgi:hypothetical protein
MGRQTNLGDFAIFPWEILQHIFSFIPNDNLLTIKNTCVIFKTLSYQVIHLQRKSLMKQIHEVNFCDLKILRLKGKKLKPVTPVPTILPQNNNIFNPRPWSPYVPPIDSDDDDDDDWDDWDD